MSANLNEDLDCTEFLDIVSKDVNKIGFLVTHDDVESNVEDDIWIGIDLSDFLDDFLLLHQIPFGLLSLLSNTSVSEVCSSWKYGPHLCYMIFRECTDDEVLEIVQKIEYSAKNNKRNDWDEYVEINNVMEMVTDDERKSWLNVVSPCVMANGLNETMMSNAKHTEKQSDFPIPGKSSDDSQSSFTDSSFDLSPPTEVTGPNTGDEIFIIKNVDEYNDTRPTSPKYSGSSYDADINQMTADYKPIINQDYNKSTMDNSI